MEPVFQTSRAHRRDPPPTPTRPPSCLALRPQPSWLLISRLPPQGHALSSIFGRTAPRDVCAPGLRGAVAQASVDSVLPGSVHRAPGCWGQRREGAERFPTVPAASWLHSQASLTCIYHTLAFCPALCLEKDDIEAIKDLVSPYKELSV